MSDKSTDWVIINPLNILRHHKSSGMDVGKLNLYPSLYDIPTALRAAIHSNLEQLEVAFQYMNDEESRKSTICGDKISIVVGKSSGRIYKLIIGFDFLNSEFENLSSELRQLISSNEKEELPSHSFEAVSDLISRESPLNLKELALSE